MAIDKQTKAKRMHESKGLPRVLKYLWRAWRLQCPRCGTRSLYRRGLAMHERCRYCDLKFEREPGYFLGAMYLNYGFTVMLVLAGYFMLEGLGNVSLSLHLWLWTSLSLLLPVLFYRHSRALWLCMDYCINPVDDANAQAYEET
jgi:uncharacterized protein (DUF983 family)